MKVSALAFGCGDVGGLMVRGTPAERERGVARALEHGINYLDTAPAYGSGESEKNLGQVLRALKPATVIVGTKWRLVAADLADVPGAVARSVETSLGRLGLERVDLLHLHNLIGRVGEERPLGVARVLEAVVPAVRRLQEQGKVRFFGVTASGETGALHRALASGAIDTAQVVFNLLNPTGAYARAGRLSRAGLRSAARARARAGRGHHRHPGAGGRRAERPGGAPPDRDSDAWPRSPRAPTTPPTWPAPARSSRWWPRATRAASSRPRCASRSRATPSSTVLIGCSDLAQLDFAATAVNKGPLSPAALATLNAHLGLRRQVLTLPTFPSRPARRRARRENVGM